MTVFFLIHTMSTSHVIMMVGRQVVVRILLVTNLSAQNGYRTKMCSATLIERYYTNRWNAHEFVLMR